MKYAHVVTVNYNIFAHFVTVNYNSFPFIHIARWFMLASHCPEIDTRWPYECGINSRSHYDAYRRSHDFTRTQHEGSKKVLRRQHGDVILSTIFIRRRYDGLTTPYDGYTASCMNTMYSR